MTNQEAISVMESIFVCAKMRPDACYLMEDCDKCRGYSTDEQEIDALKMAIDTLKKADKYRFTPCSERLPKKYVEVLAQTVWGEMNVCILYETVSGDEQWMVTNGYCLELDNVIAWMPLPEAYKEEDE